MLRVPFDDLLACAQIELAKLLQQKVEARAFQRVRSSTPILIFHLYILILRSIRSLIAAQMRLLR